MATEAKHIGRRPLQPRDSNVVSPGPGVAAAAATLARKAKARTRLGAATPASPPSVKSRVVAESKEVVSLGEELERARERRGRLRAARRLTDRVLDERGEALRREAREWGRRAEEQRRLVAELMRLIGMPEIYAPVESLRSREGRKRKDAVPCSGSASTASSTLQEEEAGVSSCGQELEAPATTTVATSELSTTF